MTLPEQPVRIGNLEIDPASYRLTRNGQPVRLTRTEWTLLQTLLLHPGQVLTYRTLLQRVWGEVYGEENDYVHTYIRRLRRKLEDVPANPQFLLTEPGLGYRLEIPLEESLSNPANKPSRRLITPLPQNISGRYIGRTAQQSEILNLLRHDTRLISIYGRGGVGKTALACKILDDLQAEPSADSKLAGILCLSTPSTGISLDRILGDFERWLETKAPTRTHTPNPKMTTEQRVADLLVRLAEAQPGYYYVLLLDNLETEQNPATGELLDPDLQTLFNVALEQGGTLRILVTSREVISLPRSLKRWERLIPLEDGLPPVEAIALLRLCDPDGAAGLRDAPDVQLREIAEKTRGFPRALEAVAGLLLDDNLLSIDALLHDEALFASQINTEIVQATIEHLSESAVRIMEAVALYGRPVTRGAIDFLLIPYTEQNVDSYAILNRLVRAYFLSYDRTTQTFAMHPLDQAYCYQRIPEGSPVDASTVPPPYTRHALRYRAAYFYRRQREPEDEWQSIDDLEAQFAEFEYLIQAGDYEMAAALLQTFDAALYAWGHYPRLISLYTRLQDNLSSNPAAERRLWLRLGEAYRAVSRITEAIPMYMRAYTSARAQRDGRDEGAALNSLGWVNYDTARFNTAIGFWEQAISVFRDSGDPRGEGSALGGLGWVYNLLGEYPKSIAYFTDALAIFRQIEDQGGICVNLGDLGAVQVAIGQLPIGVTALHESLALAEQINLPREQSYKGGYLAVALLQSGDLAEALNVIVHTRQVDTISNNHFVAAVHGIILARLGQRDAARIAFMEAIRHADSLLKHTPRLYGALYARGLARAGASLLDSATLDRSDYTAALKLCAAKGVVESNIGLLDALIACPGGDTIASIRAVLVDGASPIRS